MKKIPEGLVNHQVETLNDDNYNIKDIGVDNVIHNNNSRKPTETILWIQHSIKMKLLCYMQVYKSTLLFYRGECHIRLRKDPLFNTWCDDLIGGHKERVGNAYKKWITIFQNIDCSGDCMKINLDKCKSDQTGEEVTFSNYFIPSDCCFCH